MRQCGFFITALVCALVSGGIARAEDGPYVSVDAGNDWAVHSAKGTTQGGGFNNGTLSSVAMNDGGILGVAVGYRISDALRVDASYTYLKNSLSWQGNFGPLSPPTTFNGSTASHVFLINGYWHTRGIWQTGAIDPFIGVGAGIAYNELYNTTESLDGVSFASPGRGYSVTPAFRLGAGADIPLAHALNLTFAVDGFWLGEFKTASERTPYGGSPLPIGPWVVHDVITTNASIGLRYSF